MSASLSGANRRLAPTAAFERWLLCCGPAVSAPARVILFNLRDHDLTGDAPTQGRLIEELHLGERALRRALTELEQLGFLEITRHAGRASRYRINVERIRARIDGRENDQALPESRPTTVESDANLLRFAGTSRTVASIPPPPPPVRATPSEPPPAPRSRTGDVPERPRRPSVRGSGRLDIGDRLDNPASLLPEMSEVRWMKEQARRARVPLPDILLPDLDAWTRRGITTEDVEEGFAAAARAGRLSFSYVEGVFRRIIRDRVAARRTDGAERVPAEPTQIDAYRPVRLG